MASDAGRKFFAGIMEQMMGSIMKGEGAAAAMGEGAQMSESMMKMMGGFTVLRLTSLLGAANVKFTKEQLLGLNAQLNQIPKV